MYSKSVSYAKVLFIYECTWQNFRLRLLRHVNLLRSYSQDAKVVNESFAMCIHRWIMLYLRPQLNFLHFIYGIFNIYGQNYHFSGHTNLLYALSMVLFQFWGQNFYFSGHANFFKKCYLHGVGVKKCLLLLSLFQFLFIHCLFVSHVSQCRMDCKQSQLIHQRMLPVSSCVIRKT